ncbi:hypothetical protein VNO77_00852 [Canavalia gladiata]|uniref:Uncharacterized protein n=1 Tax=Canavalia gladiata TaxID=3824 RepID=A0AAN9R4T0_CANGL
MKRSVQVVFACKFHNSSFSLLHHIAKRDLFFHSLSLTHTLTHTHTLASLAVALACSASFIIHSLYKYTLLLLNPIQHLKSRSWTVVKRKMVLGYQCHNLGTGIRKAKYRTTHLISQKSGKLGSRTRQVFPGQASAMKKSSWIQPPAASTLATAVSTINRTTIKPIPQLQGRASSATSIVV